MKIENKQATIKNIDDFILSLNDESTRNSIVIVEGKKDVEALYYLGYIGKIKAYHHFRGTTNFIDRCAMNYNKLILLLDSDKKGNAITKKNIISVKWKNHRFKLQKKITKDNWRKNKKN